MEDKDRKNPAAGEKPEVVMVCLSASPSNVRVIRAAAKLLRQDTANAIALYVGQDHSREDTALQNNISAAKAAGFEIHVIESNDIALTIAEYAKRVGVTDLFLGNSASDSLFPVQKPVSSRLMEYLPDVDIHIIPDRRASSYPSLAKKEARFSLNIRDILLVIVIMTAATLLSMWFDQSKYSNSNIITIYILAVLIASLLTSHRIYGIIAAVLYILLFNFLFIDPRFTLLVYNPEYIMTYFVTVIAAFITGSVTIRMKSIARQSAENAYQAKVLLDTSDQLELADDRRDIIRITCMQLANLLSRNILFYEGTSVSDPQIYSLNPESLPEAGFEDETDAIRWASENRHHSGAFTSHFPGRRCRYYCIYTENEQHGTIGIDMNHRMFTEFENSILLSILREFTMALEKEEISHKRMAAEIKAENEHLRAGLLRSISHDLRTPLTSIYGNASSLAVNGSALSEEDRQKIYQDMAEDSLWLRTQMENVLAMTRLESEASLHLSVENVYDVICEAMRHVREHPDHDIRITTVSEDLFAEMDARLIIQVLINLMDNAIKHTPAGSLIQISACQEKDLVWISVADNGPGVPDKDKPHIFELFYTGGKELSDSYRSLGLGLNLCSMILQAHGGVIEVVDNIPHGSIFRFSLHVKDITL